MIDVIETLNTAVNSKADAQTAAAVAAQVASGAAVMTAHLADDAVAFAAKDATISTQTTAITALNADIAAKASTISGLQDQIAALLIEAQVDEDHIATLNTQIAGLNSDKAALQAQVASLQSGATANAAQIATLQGQITSLNSQITTLQAQVAALNSDKAALQAQVASLQAQLAASGPQLLTPDNMLPGQTDRYMWASDVPDGPVASLAIKGRRPTTMVQGTPALQPTKANGEISFQQGQNLSGGNDKDTNWRSRWGMFIFWVDLSPTSGTTQLATVNGYSGGSSDRPYRQPCFEVDQATNKLKISTFDKNGAPNMTSPLPIDCSNGKYVMVEWYRRGDRLGWRIDGKFAGEVTCGPWLANTAVTEKAWFGFTPVGNAPFKVKYWHTLDGEPSANDLIFMEGIFAWLAGDAARLLPADHRWKAAAPLLTDYRPEDKPVFWKYTSDADIDAWAAQSDAMMYSHWGEQTQAALIAGLKNSVVTDWDRADQFPAQPLAGAVNSPWFSSDLFIAGQAAFFNPATSSMYPEGYSQDLTNGGRLKLIMSRVGTTYRTGTIAMANSAGYGRRMKTGFWEVEFSFQGVLPTAPATGLAPIFPGLPWFYGWTKWMLGSYNPVETDDYEGTGKGANYIEGNSWIHNPDVPTAGLAGVRATDYHKKLFNKSLIAGATVPGAPAAFPVTLSMYDGAVHKMSKLQTKDGLCVWWLDGYELGRCMWHPHMGDPKIAIINHALDSTHGDRPLVDGEVVTMTLEKFTYKQFDTEFDAVPAGFVSRPQLLNIGGTLTVIPNCKEDHVEYRWYQNAVPLPLLMGKTTPASAGEWYVNVTNKAHAGTPDANTLRLVI